MIKGNKSEIGYGALATLIIAMVIAFILMNYSGALASIVKKGSDIEVCRLSVLAQAQTKVAGQTPVSLQCPRRQVKFFNDKVEIDGKKDDKYDFEKLDDNSVNKVVAEELRLCWYKFGEGKINVFRQNIAGDIITTASEYVCAICSEISFDKKIDRNKKFSGLVDYLKSSKIPQQDIYYFNYLINSQRNLYLLWGYIPWTQYTPWGWGTTDRITDNFEESLRKYKESSSDFEPGENYVVYFQASKPAWLKDKFGHTTSAYYIGIGKPAKVAEECKRLAN